MAEIISFSVHTRLGHKGNAGVQNAINAIASGTLDNRTAARPNGTVGVVYADARADIEARLSWLAGLVPQSVDKAVSLLYHEVSKHVHGQQADPIRIKEGDQSAAEVVAVLSILVFARRRLNFPVDVRYTSTDCSKDFLISELD